MTIGKKDQHLRRVHRMLDQIEAELLRFSVEEMGIVLHALKGWNPSADFVPGMNADALASYLARTIKHRHHEDL